VREIATLRPRLCGEIDRQTRRAWAYRCKSRSLVVAEQEGKGDAWYSEALLKMLSL
jgi:hypothetical protein